MAPGGLLRKEMYLRAPTRADVLWRLRVEREVLLDGAGGDAADAPFCLGWSWSGQGGKEGARLKGERNPMRAIAISRARDGGHPTAGTERPDLRAFF